MTPSLMVMGQDSRARALGRVLRAILGPSEVAEARWDGLSRVVQFTNRTARREEWLAGVETIFAFTGTKTTGPVTGGLIRFLRSDRVQWTGELVLITGSAEQARRLEQTRLFGEDTPRGTLSNYPGHSVIPPPLRLDSVVRHLAEPEIMSRASWRALLYRSEFSKLRREFHELLERIDGSGLAPDELLDIVVRMRDTIDWASLIKDHRQMRSVEDFLSEHDPRSNPERAACSELARKLEEIFTLAEWEAPR